MRNLFLLTLPILILAVLWLSLKSGAQESEALEMIGNLKSKKISESSGLMHSHHIDDAWWTMNDSGNGTEVYLFGDKGKTLLVADLKGAKNRDWEAMSGFTHNDKGYLLIADVGDNVSRRAQCEIYTFEEPKYNPDKKNKSKKATAKRFKFRFQNGARNCEAAASNPDGSAIYLIEKVFLEANTAAPGIYKLEIPLDQLDSEEDFETVLVAQRVGKFPFRGVTGMAISPDGKTMAIRNYLNAHLFKRETVDGKLASWESTFENTKPRSIPMPLQVQGEAICFTRDGNHLIVTSETAGQAIWKVKIAAEDTKQTQPN